VYSYPQVNDEKLCTGFRDCAYGAGAARFFRVVSSPEIPLDTARRNLGMCKLRQKSLQANFTTADSYVFGTDEDARLPQQSQKSLVRLTS